jgi:hypothetical protein
MTTRPLYPAVERKKSFVLWRLLERLERHKLPPLLLGTARRSVRGYYRNRPDVDNITAYLSGLWFRAITNEGNPLTISNALRLSLADYLAGVEFGEREATAKTGRFENAYADFLDELKKFIVYYFNQNKPESGCNPVLLERFRVMGKKDLPAFLLSCARPAFAAHYSDFVLAEQLAIYQAGYWFGMITNSRKDITIAAAFGMNETSYKIAVMYGRFEAVGSNTLAFGEAYQAFLNALAESKPA